MRSAATRWRRIRPESAWTAFKSFTYTIACFIAGVGGFLLASWQIAITSNQGSSCHPRTLLRLGSSQELQGRPRLHLCSAVDIVLIEGL